MKNKNPDKKPSKKRALGLQLPKGTTLIEMLVYFGILGIVLFAAMSFALQILTVSKLSDNYHELQTNMDFIAEKLVTTLETAESINNASVFDVDSGKLSFNVANVQNSPTSFYLENGAVYIKQGANAAVRLNSSDARFTRFKFHKISSPKAQDHIVMDLEAALDKDITRLDKKVSLHISLSLRK